MTYATRPLYGVKEQFFGPAAYAQTQFQQHLKPQPAQSMAVGESGKEPTIEGYEKTIFPQEGTKQELMGMAANSIAQSNQTWVDKD